MRYLILSDIHGNWDALIAVLRRVRRKHIDCTLMLGDVVGYGAAPNQVVDEVRRLPGEVYSVRGNHDKVVAALDDGAAFNEAARAAAFWTRKRLTKENLGFVRRLPRGPVSLGDGPVICHGSPADEDTYLFGAREALNGFEATDSDLIFFGHTHLPSVFTLYRGGLHARLLAGGSGSILLEPGCRYLINPGSIGQPRDRNPRAAFMLYDSACRVVKWRRERYALERAQRRILHAGLPPALAHRLAHGV